jgi:Transcriptional regulator containing an amidase domain and an AraC-type DNA-binding HTH domain
MYLFENVEHEERYKTKIFVTSVEHSSFHWHYDYELILILKGSLQIKVGSRVALLGPRDIILLNSQEAHELQRTEEENLCLFIQINKTMISDLKNDSKLYYFYLDSKDQKHVPKNGYKAYIRMAACIGTESLKKELCNIYRVKSLIYMMIADLFEFTLCDIHQKPKEINGKNSLSLLMYIIDFIRGNFKDNNILENLYKSVGVSEKSVYRILKTNIGLSPKSLVLNNRIENAKYMLKFSDKPIEYITCNSGFCSGSTFYRTFKKMTGVTPAEYRERGGDVSVDSNIKGYLKFDIKEALYLLQNLVDEI